MIKVALDVVTITQAQPYVEGSLVIVDADGVYYQTVQNN